MPLALGEAHHLVLDRRAIARPDPGDLAGIKRRAVEIGADHGVRRRCRLGDVADHLRRRDPLGQERERHRRVVAGLHVEPGPVDRACRRAAAACRSSAGRARSRSARRVCDRPSDGASPTRPAGIFSSPIWMRPPRNVPVVSTTRPARDAPAVAEHEPADPALPRRAADPRPRLRRCRDSGISARIAAMARR